MSKLTIYDTTLRDGSQTEGVSFTVNDKLKITAKLDELGVHYIEGGWPGSNPKDREYFKAVKKLKLKYKKHPLLHPPTMNIGTIKGGDKVNMVADFCEFSLDTRFMPGMKASQVIKEIKQIVASEAKRFKLVIDDLQQPYEIPANDPFVRTYVESAKKLGLKANLKGSEGATVITFFKKHNKIGRAHV